MHNTRKARLHPNGKIAALAVAFGFILLAFALRMSDLGTRQFGGKDEPFTCTFTFLSFQQILSETFRLHEPHPVLSYFAQHIWYVLTGRSEFAMRFLSGALGLMSVALIWRLVREMWPAKTKAQFALPLLALALMALNPLGITYDRILRMYALHGLLTLASTLLMVRLVKGHRKVADVAGYILISLLALHTHYYATLVLVSQNLFVFGLLLFSRAHRSRSLLLSWLVAQISVAALFLPWLLAVGNTLSNYTGFVSSPSPIEAFNEWMGSLLVSDLDWTTEGRATFALIGAIVCIVGLIRLLQSPARLWAGLLLSWLVLTPLVVWYAAQSRPIFTPRYLIATLSPFVILAACALMPPRSAQATSTPRNQPEVKQRFDLRIWAGAGIGLFLSAALGWGMARALVPLYQTASQPNGTWPALVQFAERYTHTFPPEQERFLLNFPDQAFGCYYSEGSLAGKAPFFVLPPFAGDEAGSTREVQKMVAEGVRRVVFQRVDSGWDPNRLAEKTIDVDYEQIEEVFSGQWIVKIYARPVISELRPINITFGDVARIDSAAVYPDVGARLIEVHVRWAAGSAPLKGTEKIFMHVLRNGEAGTLFGQRDIQLLPEDIGNVRTYGVRLADQLPPGNYVLRIGIYDPSQPNAPRLQTSQGQDAAEWPVGQIAP